MICNFEIMGESECLNYGIELKIDDILNQLKPIERKILESIKKQYVIETIETNDDVNSIDERYKVKNNYTLEINYKLKEDRLTYSWKFKTKKQ
jgi:hypothetical protein